MMIPELVKPANKRRYDDVMRVCSLNAALGGWYDRIFYKNGSACITIPQLYDEMGQLGISIDDIGRRVSAYYDRINRNAEAHEYDA